VPQADRAGDRGRKRASLESAEVIVTGGMGLGGPEHLSLARDLAGVLAAWWVRRRASCTRDGRALDSDRSDGQDRLAQALRPRSACRARFSTGSGCRAPDHRRCQQGPGAAQSSSSATSRCGGRPHDRPAVVELLRQRKGRDGPLRRSTPPPFRAEDFIAQPTDRSTSGSEVGVLVVGAGPAGLACAIRFGQLLQEDPEIAATSATFRFAVAEKGKHPARTWCRV